MLLVVFSDKAVRILPYRVLFIPVWRDVEPTREYWEGVSIVCLQDGTEEWTENSFRQLGETNGNRLDMFAVYLRHTVVAEAFN